MKKCFSRQSWTRWLGATTTALLLGSPAIAQESLPFPPTPSGSKAGPTIADSTYSPLPSQSHLPADAPNILVIMLDDVGPALPDTFGGVIKTRTLSRVAENGVIVQSLPQCRDVLPDAIQP